MGFDELRRRFGVPPRSGTGPDAWERLRASESWTHGFELAFDQGVTAPQVNEFLDAGRPDAPTARLETDFKARAIRVVLPPGSSFEDFQTWVDLVDATGLFVPLTTS